MIARHVAAWADAHPLSPSEIDCVTAVMLKVLDGKCKMSPESKALMRHLYHAVKAHPGAQLGDDIHLLIAEAEASPDDALRSQVHAMRVQAEALIDKPVMKRFKAMIQAQGLFDVEEPA